MRKIVLVALLLVISSITVSAERIGKLDYLGSELIVVSGNLTLNFNWSENSNKNDITVVKVSYDPTFNLTIFRIESKTITYDYAFINDTKEYHYNTTNNTKDYYIEVDYGSIVVPMSPYGHIKELLEEANETIAEKDSELENLTARYNRTFNMTSQLNATIENLTGYKIVAELKLEDYDDLKNESEDKTKEITRLKSCVSDLELMTNEKNETLESLESPFCLSYPKGPVSFIYFNASWFAIGIILTFIILYLRKNEESVIKIVKRRGEKLDVKNELSMAQVRAERPPVEKQFLKPVEPKKDMSSDIDSVINRDVRR